MQAVQCLLVMELVTHPLGRIGRREGGCGFKEGQWVFRKKHVTLGIS